MSIRLASDEDAADITSLLQQLHDAPSLQYVPSCVRQQSKQFVYEIDGKIVGFLLATLTDYGFTSYGMLEELFVDQQHRGRGIGRQLVEQGLRWFKSENSEVVFVSAGDEEAVKFYEKVGFQACIGAWLYAASS